MSVLQNGIYIYIYNIIQKQNMFLKALFSFMLGFVVLSMEKKQTLYW